MAVVGAGPAGLSCAYFLALDGYRVTVFEKQEKIGGMLTLGIPAFRLEKEVVNAEIEVLRELGVEFKTGIEVGKDLSLDDLRREGFKAIYLAIGAQSGRGLGIEGEDSEGVMAGVDFLRGLNLGKTLPLSGRVLVIGGGNVAIDVARAAVRQADSEVALYCLEGKFEMPALPEEIEEAAEEGVNMNHGWGPNRILTENGRVCAVEFIRCRSVFDETGSFAPKFDENVMITVPADHVLLSVGQSIDWGGLLSGSKIRTNPNGTAIADGFTYQTQAPDVFVGGDVFTGPGFAIDAIAAGKQGAISMHRFVWEGQSLTLGRDRREYRSLDKDSLDRSALTMGFDNSPRQRPAERKDAPAFTDKRLTFTEEQLKLETARCLGCGAVQLDPAICVGCGMCVSKCGFDAIRLVRKYNAYATTYERLPLHMGPNAVKRAGKIAVNTLKAGLGAKSG